MPPFRGPLRLVLIVIGALLASLSLTACDDTLEATVTHVVDGDTIDVAYDGEEVRVRLLNIDTPETVDPDSETECMGPEATDFLRKLLPKGTTVELQRDEELHDKYGRYLAGVFLDGSLVNAEIARAGYGIAVLYEPNDRFYEEVRQAQDEARAAELGLYDPTAQCSLPAQVAAVSESVDATQTSMPDADAGISSLEDYGAQIAAATSSAADLRQLLNGDRDGFPLVAFTHSRIRQMQQSVNRATDDLDQIADANHDAIAVEQERLAAEEAERRAAEEAAQQAAAEEAQREAERARVQQSEHEPATKKSAPDPTPEAPSEPEQSPDDHAPARQPESAETHGTSGGYDGYTGCRAYGGYPPNAVDEKGRPYTKIDCDTKMPIG